MVKLPDQRIGQDIRFVYTTEYLKLGDTKDGRMKNYRALFSHHVEEDLLEDIRSSINKGMAIGHDRFKDKVEVLTGRRLRPKKVGRPVGWRMKRDGI